MGSVDESDMSFRRVLVLGGFCLLSACSLVSSTPNQLGTTVRSAPPAPRAEGPRPAAPAAGDIWVAGYWDNTNGSYFWQPGRWVAPKPGYAFVPAEYRLTDGTWTFTRPRWRRLTVAAAR
jgi:hypothetical protein